MFLENDERNLNQIAIAYLIQLNGVSSCIPGAKSPEQLRSNIKALNVKISQKELRCISDIHNKWKDLENTKRTINN